MEMAMAMVRGRERIGRMDLFYYLWFIAEKLSFLFVGIVPYIT